ncbi:MAG: hydroxymethylbilane synthase [Bacteroidota bacterium]
MIVRIGTRNSDLALWQAHYIRTKLSELDIKIEILEIESFGDRIQDIPIHKLGDKGVFTKALDEALINNDIDLAVHSLKDVPTVLHEELVLCAVPTRENPFDVLVRSHQSDSNAKQRIIATGSIRRTAFWKNRFPEDSVIGLRGNVPTRIRKIDTQDCYGGIFAYAGLHRLQLDGRISQVLTWMVPAPSQGALGIIIRKDSTLHQTISQLEDPYARRCVDIERSFMNKLEAGCSSPVGGYAHIKDQQLLFHGTVLSVDGRTRIDINKQIPVDSAHTDRGKEWAEEALEQGASALVHRHTERG